MGLPLAALAAAAIAGAAWRAGALTRDGAAAAWTVGTAVLWGTGWAGGAVLAAFFFPSSALSRLLPPPPTSLDAKGDRRDWRQVYANGGAALLGGLAGLANPGLGLWIVTGAFAAAGADTWATTWGARSRTPPRHLLTGRPVPPGTSGGITLLGSVGAAAGALLVAATGAAASRSPALLSIGTLIGFSGMLADSALGAAIQGRFECRACGVASEWRVHRCGAATVLRGGRRWLDNDGVNGLASALAATAGWLAWRSVAS